MDLSRLENQKVPVYLCTRVPVYPCTRLDNSFTISIGVHCSQNTLQVKLEFTTSKMGLYSD